MRSLAMALALSSLTAEDCKNMYVPTVYGGGPEWTVRFSDGTTHGPATPDQPSCTVECDIHPPGTNRTVTECATFGDVSLRLQDKMPTNCTQTAIEAPDKDPSTTDPELIVLSCAEFFMYTGYDRDVTRTGGNMRQELVLKTKNAVSVFQDMLGSAAVQV